MDLKSTIAIILKDLEEARSILDDLRSYPGVPAIQIELAKAKCRSAEEVIKLVGDLELSIEANSANTEDNPIPVDDVVETKEEDPPDSKFEVFEISDLEDGLEEEKSSIGVSKIQEEIIDQVVQPESTKEPLDDNVSEQAKKGQILADKFSKQSSINESIANKRHDNENEDRNKLRPVKNLNDAIGINEKFMFVRELFDGNQELYTKTINELNGIADIDDAFKLLSESAPNTSDGELFDQLLDIVKRKLTSS